MDNNAAIGVFDSGIGGLTVLRELVRLMPQENFIYFGDTARVPYGSRPPAQILAFMHQILNFFQTQQVKMAVDACNAMTAVSMENARRSYPFPLVGMSTGIKTALQATGNKHIGVIATQATIASGRHGKAIRAADSEAVIYPQACPKFVPLIEQGEFDGPAVEAAAVEYLAPLKDGAVDTVILACTHYPFISPVVGRIMGPRVTLVDPAGETAQDALNMLVKQGISSTNGTGSVRLCFSADLGRAEQCARAILGERPIEFAKVVLQD